MQTFLPYKDFTASAQVLDMKRLGKQRVETYQLMKTILSPVASKGWVNHPAAKMWKGHEAALLEYQKAICEVWSSKGYKDTCLDKTIAIFLTYATSAQRNFKTEYPKWLGDERFHASHRSNLLRKKPEWYSQFHWSESPDIPYIWPTV